MRFKKEQYNRCARAKVLAMTQIAKELGNDHQVTKMMGSLAWGRHHAEQGPDGNLQTAIIEMSYIDGYFDCINLWCRDNDPKAQKIILKLYPTGMRDAFE